MRCASELTVDIHPFIEVPVGTTPKDLSDGGRLFTMSDGAVLRVGADGAMNCVLVDGSARP